MSRMMDLALTHLVGRTPWYPIRTSGAPVYVKLEGNNPGGSVKDRAVLGMLTLAEAKGLIREGATVVEPTSGNTGIALAMFGAALGLRVVLTMPETMSEERRKVLMAYGAHLELTPGSEGMAGAVRRCGEILSETPGAFTLDQFSNPGNPWAHSVTTGPEILSQAGMGDIGAFVAGVGTGGTISGVGRVLKAARGNVRVVAVEPQESPLLSKGSAGKHGIQGIGANFVPENLDMSVVDQVVTVSTQEAKDVARWLARRHGLFSGISTGANVAAAMRIAQELPPDSRVVTIQCDRQDKYLSVL
ncbi:cysteine synthase [Thermanaerovibrio acidaminovorans DSM 6589]|uniref:cysteine synthase n=1 Tax=Thermanaerovibrio acidaminovorans (strain ATCC 49978 / DSM 6589 / Su883) TaxID=525903 RepID=D1B7F7_THEAS|nr:cysteine synthase A [Thermanaerovibrio acidaminovorans]ACZ19948.1 cysteine synthase [Thermanaerovibrio acidaminovorans DSM 6589]